MNTTNRAHGSLGQAWFHERNPGNLRLVAFGWLWLASPFVVIAIIWHSRALLELVALHHRRCLAVGCAGAVSMLLGATVIPGAAGMAMFYLGTPLAGLVVWLRGDDGDDHDDAGPDVPPFDWDGFERSFWAHVRRGGTPPRKPRSPSAA